MCLTKLRKKQTMERQYMNDFHKKSSETSQQEVMEMSKHPLSLEDALKQTKTKSSEMNAKTRKFKNMPKE